MSVIRIKKARDKPYVILDITALNDARLSFRAKGLHTYLMSRPDNWQVHIEQLEKQSPREARDAIRGAMQELETCGYIRRQRVRGAKGRMMGWDTTIYETPLLAKLDAEDQRLGGEAIGIETGDSPITDYPTSVQPTLDQPTSGGPTSVQPSSANPQLIINDSTQYGEETNIDSTHKPPSPKVSDVAERFEQFWKAYPNKTAKGRARKAWNQIKPSEALFQQILDALTRQRASPKWQKNQGEFIPHPATWLNDQRWEDESSAPTSRPYVEWGER
jgi:hypothetical protein